MPRTTFTIRDGIRNETFQVSNHADLLTAFKLLRGEQMKEIENLVEEKIEELDFKVEDSYCRQVEIKLDMLWSVSEY